MLANSSPTAVEVLRPRTQTASVRHDSILPVGHTPLKLRRLAVTNLRLRKTIQARPDDPSSTRGMRADMRTVMRTAMRADMRTDMRTDTRADMRT